MTTLTVTAKGQITLKRDLLQHISTVFGLLKDKISGNIVSLEDMNQAIAAGWTGEKQWKSL